MNHDLFEMSFTYPRAKMKVVFLHPVLPVTSLLVTAPPAEPVNEPREPREPKPFVAEPRPLLAMCIDKFYLEYWLPEDEPPRSPPRPPEAAPLPDASVEAEPVVDAPAEPVPDA